MMESDIINDISSVHEVFNKCKTYRDSAILAVQLAVLIYLIVLNTEIEKMTGTF